MPSRPTRYPPGVPHIDLPPGWQYVPDLTEAVATSATAPVQVGAGRYRFNLPGGGGINHPSTGQYAVFPRRDAYKNPTGWGTSSPYGNVILIDQIEVHTAPSASATAYVRVGFSDSPSIATSAFVGIDTELQFLTGNEAPCSAFEQFGSPTAFRTPYAGPFNGGNTFVRGGFHQITSTVAYRPSVWGLDSAGADTNEIAVYAFNPTMAGGGQVGGGYIYIAADSDTAETIECTFTHYTLQVSPPV